MTELVSAMIKNFSSELYLLSFCHFDQDTTPQAGSVLCLVRGQALRAAITRLTGETTLVCDLVCGTSTHSEPTG